MAYRCLRVTYEGNGLKLFVIPSVAQRSRGIDEAICGALPLPLSEGSKFCAIRRTRSSSGRGAKLAQQERHRTWSDERFRERQR